MHAILELRAGKRSKLSIRLFFSVLNIYNTILNCLQWV